ncbi:toxin-antitoxin system TumE family protein [Roseateles sp.]|uniref:toxin-antitoxin system TumE family protein n=1 Tax=Roseateles sp. TaxID=1971397 RepID=UPI003BA56FD1
MKASLLLRERIPFREDSFAELVLWQVPSPLPGSAHSFKYRLAFVRSGVCLVRFDNEAGKGDHRHVRGKESKYSFVSPEKLVQDFLREARRADDEDRDS